jgi:hypothetical protein
MDALDVTNEELVRAMDDNLSDTEVEAVDTLEQYS